VDLSNPELPAALHSFTSQDGLPPEPDHAELHNGMARGPGGQTTYLTHTKEQTIYPFVIGAEGRLTGKTRFVTIPAHDGLPDGAASTQRAAIGAPSMAGAGYAASTPMALMTAILSCPSASPRNARLAAQTWTSFT
jgi:SMP-30/Gluconolactonase/LRE-like region